MRSSVITSWLLAGVAAIVLLPALSARTTRRTRPARVASDAVAHQARPDGAAEADEPREAASFPEALRPAARLAREGRWEEALVALSTVSAPTPREAALRETLAAEALRRAGDPVGAEEAGRRAMEAARSEPALRARAAFIAGEAREAAGDPVAAAELYAQAAEGPSRSLSRHAALRRCLALLDSDAGGALQAIAPVAGRGDATAGELAAAARAAEAAGDAEAARRWLRRLRVEHPASPEARVADAHALLPGETAVALAEGRSTAVLDRIDALLEAGLEDVAAPEVEAALKHGVPAPESARLELLAGRLLRMKGQSGKALVHLTKAAAAKDAVGCRAAYHAAKASLAARQRAESPRWLKRAADGCPCEWRDRAALEIAATAESERRLDGALAQWRKVAADGATPAVRRQAAWRLGWSSWKAGRRDEAAAEFDRLAAAEPESREAAAARYWSARRLEQSGDAQGARAARLSLASDFPREWYGVLAAEEAGIELPLPSPCSSADVEAALADAAFELAGDAASARALLDVESLGLTDDALLEADALGTSPERRAAFRALALSRAGRSREALREFRRAIPDWRRRADVPPAMQCAAWPVEHEALIRSCCRSTGLQPELVFGLVHQESVFDETAVSHAGARGLMQIMPATGQTIARWLGERVTTPKLLEPSLNVRYGTTYLKRLLDESGRVEVALAGYNAGPGRAKRWWAESGDDVALFVESIPFDETRDYVKAIAVNERLYRARLAEASVTGQ